MKLSQIKINRRFIFYVFGFSTLGLLLFYNLNNLFVTYNANITNEAGKRQLLTVKTLSARLENNLEAIVYELRESVELIAIMSYDLNASATIFEGFFSEYNHVTDSTANDFIVSIRWLDMAGKELLKIPLNGDPLSSSEPVITSSLDFKDRADVPFRVVGPYLSPEKLPLIWLTISENTGKYPGYIATEINITKLICNTLLSINALEDVSLFIIDQNGYIISAHSHPHAYDHPEVLMSNIRELPQDCFGCHDNFDLLELATKMPYGWGKWEKPDHTELYAFSTMEIGNNRWSIGLGLPEYQFTNLIGYFEYHLYVAIFLILGVLGLLTAFLVDLNRKRLRAEEQANYLQQRTALLREKKEMNEQYTKLVEQANDAIYIKHIDRFVLVNHAWEKLSGYSRKELLSPDFDILSLISPEERDYIRERGKKHTMGKPMEPTYEFTLIRKDGKEVEVEVNVNYIQYDGEPAVQGILRDISERKRAEEQKELMLALTNMIRESRDLNELAENSLKYVTEILDMNIGILYIHNDQKKELQLVAQKGMWEGILSFQEKYRMDKDEKGIAVQTALQQEMIFVEDLGTSPLLSYIPDRSTLAGKSLISIPLNSQDVLLGVLQLARATPLAEWDYDLTNLKQIANAIAIGLHRRKISSELEESEKRLKHFFENSTEVIYSLTPDGKLKEMNKAGIHLFFNNMDEEIKGVDVIKFWKSRKNRREYVKRMERDGFVKDIEMEYLCNDGEMHTFLESAVDMRDENGKIVEYQGIMRDITSLKKAEEEMQHKNIELERVNAELRELDLMKDNFIATISHELRTPLTSIKGSIDILLKGMAGKLDKKKEEILTICSRNSERIITLVNDLLVIQHLESGRTELKLQPLEIENIIPAVIDKAMSDSHKDGVRLVTRFDMENPDKVIMADQSKISHAMFNLLTNAIKFSDKGTVVVELAYHNGEVHLSVTDEGIGIPEKMKNKIFDKFTQGDGSMTREKGGAGLGLAITRTIVEKHGGRIWVESKAGMGSKFTFSLPCYPKNDNDASGNEPVGD